MTDQVTAIPGTRRAAKELVDGTLSLTVHIQPTDKAAFHRLFPEIDMPIAIAPLAIGVLPKAEEPAPEIGPRCKLAVMWCKDEKFQLWLHGQVPGQAWPIEMPAEDIAAQQLKESCGVLSRRELDTQPTAGARFDDLIRRPYQSYLREHPNGS